VARDFRADQRSRAQATLDEYGSATYECERERVQLAVLALSGGDLAALRRYTDAAKVDYRDVLYWAEYLLIPNRR
jgi:hypothetical protein